jgi:hypothetical protein
MRRAVLARTDPSEQERVVVLDVGSPPRSGGPVSCRSGDVAVGGVTIGATPELGELLPHQQFVEVR